MHPHTFDAYKMFFAAFLLSITGVKRWILNIPNFNADKYLKLFTTSAALSEPKGEFFGDADTGLFEGDMRLTGDQLLALGLGKEEEARRKRQEEEEEEGGEGEGEFFGDAIEDGLFEGDMRLTGDQLLALQRATLETHGDMEGVTYSYCLILYKKHTS